jgi:hypothetical protein
MENVMAIVDVIALGFDVEVFSPEDGENMFLRSVDIYH